MLGGLFLALDPMPIGALFVTVGIDFVAKDMGVAVDHLVRDGLGDIVKGEQSGLFSHLRVEDDLQQQIAKLLTQVHRILPLNRVSNFIGFFDGEGDDGFERLLDIPRAAVFCVAQLAHDVEDAVQTVAGGKCGDGVLHGVLGFPVRVRRKHNVPYFQAGVTVEIRRFRDFCAGLRTRWWRGAFTNDQGDVQLRRLLHDVTLAVVFYQVKQLGGCNAANFNARLGNGGQSWHEVA